ncbi:MAG: PqqD family peptide modification chaperone [Polyangiaceae bacterium]|nr:PqqD family peptide modification chaperone [Polyangiaceae bacterium]
MHVRIHQDVKVTRDGSGRYFLFAADSGKTRYLNETASFVWDRCDEGLSIDDISARLASEYDVSQSNAHADIRSLVDQLAEAGFARVHDTAAASQSSSWSLVGDGPREIDISITGRCNARCPYCFYGDEMVKRADLPKVQWLSFFDELGRLPTQSLCVSGGEAFTRPDLWELIDGIIANRMRYSMLSNGALITERTLAAFGEGKRRARLSSIQLSVDGSTAEVHDRSRGHGFFDRTIAAIRLLLEARFPVTVRVTVNRHNVDDLEATAKLLLEDIGIRSFGTNDAMPEGKGRLNADSIGLTPSQRVTAMNTLARLAERYPGRVQASAGPLANHRTYAKLRRWKHDGEPVSNGGYLTACGCVFNKLAVLHDGAIVPCNVLPDLHMGRIGHDAVRTIWRSHATLRAIRDRRRIPMTAVPGCETCEWAEACNGSCPGLAYELTGDINRANPHDCYRRFLEQAGQHDCA